MSTLALVDLGALSGKEEAMTEPTMSLAQVRQVPNQTDYGWPPDQKDYNTTLRSLDSLCATVEALYGALKESQAGLLWAKKRLGVVSAINAVLDAPLSRNTVLLAQLEHKEASIPILPKEIPTGTGCAGIDIIVSKRVDPSPISDDSHRRKEYKP